jgi:acid phosphatase type 7
VFFGHVHNYERTCALYQDQCKGVPKKGQNGIDTYNNSKYTAPVHVVVGMAGFSLDKFPSTVSLSLRSFVFLFTSTIWAKMC